MYSIIPNPHVRLYFIILLHQLIKVSLFSLGCLIFFDLTAQDYSWWNQKHNWDGVTPWEQYIKLGQKHLSPTALPPYIPALTLQNQRQELQISTGAFYNPELQTQHLQLRYYRKWANSHRIEWGITAFQRYSMTTSHRDKHFFRDEDGKGVNVGDLWIRFAHVIWTSNRFKHQLEAQAGFKTASGGGLDAGQFTDTPGYTFELSWNYHVSDHSTLNVAAGFFAYQMYDLRHRQNDGASFRSDFTWHSSIGSFSAGVSGYWGYLEIGDRPILSHAQFRPSRLGGRLSFQVVQGLLDYPYTGIQINFGFFNRLNESE